MKQRPPWTSSSLLARGLALLACLLLAAFLLLLKAPVPAPTPTRQPLAASLEIAKLDGVSADRMLREEASLRDPSPLFLPTPLNSTQAVKPESSLREPGDSFVGYTPKLIFEGGAIRLPLPEAIQVPSKPADVLGRLPWERPFTGLGQRDQKQVERLPAREAYLEVFSAGNGNLLFSKALTDISLPENVDWKPCEFLIQSDVTGMVGSPPLVQSSGSETVDRVFGTYLAREWISAEQKARLPAGLYRILLGP